MMVFVLVLVSVKLGDVVLVLVSVEVWVAVWV